MDFQYFPFFTNTFKYNNFTITEEEAKKYLIYFINHEEFNNSFLYDLLNYEKLIYIEMTYKDNNEITFLIEKLKQRIADNWLKKQQFLNRIS